MSRPYCKHEAALILELWSLGLSATLIAERANLEFPNSYVHRTRNSIIGLVHRHGRGRDQALKRQTKVRAVNLKSRRSPPRFLKSLAKVMPTPVPVAVNHDGPLIALVDLEPHHCRFMPKQPQDGFCGAEKVPGKSYCGHHCVIAYLPPTVEQRQFSVELRNRLSAAHSRTTPILRRGEYTGTRPGKRDGLAPTES